MKKFIGLISVAVICLSGCTSINATVEKEKEIKSIEERTPSMFVEIERCSIWSIVYHRDTKVMYAVSKGGCSKGDGVFTLLVNADGTPMIWEE